MKRKKRREALTIENSTISQSAFAVGKGARAATKVTNQGGVETVLAEIDSLRELLEALDDDDTVGSQAAARGGLDALEKEVTADTPRGSRLSAIFEVVRGSLADVASVATSVTSLGTALHAFMG